MPIKTPSLAPALTARPSHPPATGPSRRDTSVERIVRTGQSTPAGDGENPAPTARRHTGARPAADDRPQCAPPSRGPEDADHGARQGIAERALADLLAGLIAAHGEVVLPSAVAACLARLTLTTKLNPPTLEEALLFLQLLSRDESRGQGAFRTWPTKAPAAPSGASGVPPFESPDILNNQAKYREYEQALESSGFRDEWAAVKRRFPMQSKGRREFLRTPTSEWTAPSPAPDFASDAERFQVALDLLCWKYCLWGVRDDRPQLMRPTVSRTPYGTQIVIPAYLSLDARRDLNWKVIQGVHALHSPRRQGAKMSASRLESRRQCESAAQADREAKSQGLKGEARFHYVREHSRPKFAASTDEAQLRRCIKRGSGDA